MKQHFALFLFQDSKMLRWMPVDLMCLEILGVQPQFIMNEDVDFPVANNDSAMQCFAIKSHNKIIDMKQNDTYGIVKLDSGKSYRQEFYFGLGYLTQNSRKLQVLDNAVKVTIQNSENRP